MDFRSVLWSTSYDLVIHALIETHGYLCVKVHHHVDNPVDKDAISIALDHDLAGGIGAIERMTNENVWIIGYVSRSEPNRDKILELLKEKDRPINASLVRSDVDSSLVLRIPELDPPDPNEDKFESEIPY